MLARILLILAAALAQAVPAQPAAYPARPLKLIVADNPGSSSDTRARQVGAKLAEALGQPVVIDNRPGGSMMIAAEVGGNPPEEFAAYVRADRARWKRAVDDAGLIAE